MKISVPIAEGIFRGHLVQAMFKKPRPRECEWLDWGDPGKKTQDLEASVAVHCTFYLTKMNQKLMFPFVNIHLGFLPVL